MQENGARDYADTLQPHVSLLTAPQEPRITAAEEGNMQVLHYHLQRHCILCAYNDLFALQKRERHRMAGDLGSLPAKPQKGMSCSQESSSDMRLQVRPTILTDLINLLGSKEGADIAFNMGGESVHAHKHVLNARCPMLCKMGERAGGSAQEVEGVSPRVFAVILNYIYADGLPEVQFPALHHCSSVNSRL
jgi:hypothetical protein